MSWNCTSTSCDFVTPIGEQSKPVGLSVKVPIGIWISPKSSVRAPVGQLGGPGMKGLLHLSDVPPARR